METLVRASACAGDSVRFPARLVLTDHPESPPASDPSGSSASPRYRSAAPSFVPPDVSLHSPNEKAVLMSTDVIRAF